MTNKAPPKKGVSLILCFMSPHCSAIVTHFLPYLNESSIKKAVLAKKAGLFHQFTVFNLRL